MGSESGTTLADTIAQMAQERLERGEELLAAFAAVPPGGALLIDGRAAPTVRGTFGGPGPTVTGTFGGKRGNFWTEEPYHSREIERWKRERRRRELTEQL